MVILGVLAFFGYVLFFAVSQQLIARRHEVVNIPRREAPGWFIFQMLCSVFFALTVLTAGDQKLFQPAVIAGTPIVLAGLVLSMRAQSELGKNWVGGIGLHKQHRLITSGPYRYVRHPLYSGMLVSAIGLGIIGWNIFFLLMTLCFACSYAIRSIGEDHALHQRFGKQYLKYYTTTGSLIPRIRK